MTELNTTNNEQIIYNNSLIKLTVLGGIKIEGLDRMRATLKAELPESPKPPIRHNLDLYNDTQLEKFIRKTAERLEIGTSVIAASLSELTAQLESYRLQKIQEQEPEEEAIKILNPKEKKAALDYLQQENLIEQTKLDLAKSGIIGEEINALILLLAMSSRKCADPLSVVCLAKSGIGKSYLMERVAACFPTEDLLENTQMTENSFYYYKREEIRGKVFLIEDLDGAAAVLYPIRELQSKKRISKTVTSKDKNGVNRTITLVVEGPVSVIGCTTKERIYEDNANRSILIYLDGSKEQDTKILEYQKQIKAGIIDKQEEKKAAEILQNIQRVLEPVKIINPYALLIDLPKEIFKPRRTMGLLLNFIEAITYYHQWQRHQQVNKTTGEVFIETEPKDIEIAFTLLKETLFRKSDELSGACRSFYEMLRKWVKENKKEEGFFSSEIRQTKRMNPRTLNRYLTELVNYNKVQIIGGQKHKTGYQYQLSQEQNTENLQEEITYQINQVLKKVNEKHKEREGSDNGRTKRKIPTQVSKK
ncbi:MAG: hypothetical protein QMB65_05955 [Vicingaceae bacterium]